MDATTLRAGPGPGLRAAIVIAAAGSAGAGLIHATVAGSHADSRALVWMFAACAAAQLGWAAVVVLVPKRSVLLAGVVINSAAVGAWFLSRTVGISFVDALAEPEAIGTQDLLAALLAAAAVGGAVLAIAQPIARRSVSNAWSAAIVFATVVLAVPALAASHTHGHDHLADEHIHAVGAAAHTHADGVEHEHDAAVAGAVEHSHDSTEATGDGTTSTTHAHTTTTGATHTDDGHTHGSTTPVTNPTDPEQVPHSHGPSTPTTPGVTTPPHTHPAPSPTGPIVTVNDPRLSAAQQTAAGNLLVNTVQAMTAFPTVASVEAAGYQSIGDASTGFEHFVNWTFFSDGTELNPQRIESIVARVNANGSRTIVSGMYILTLGKTMADVPDIAGTLTTWHDHQDLCWAPTPTGGNRVTGIAVNGTCPNGGANVPTPPMLHVWLEPQPCGPFAGIEGTHGSSCQHTH